MSRFGACTGCHVCGKTVYFAEEVLVVGRTYHKACFNCSSCNKRLDSTTAVAENDATLYCHSCYFGLKGYIYGGGAGTLASKAGGSNKSCGSKCPVCGRTVSIAEELLFRGQKYQMCYKCSSCSRMLDITTLADNDRILYCHNCHKLNFGKNPQQQPSGPSSGPTGYSSYGVTKGGARSGGSGGGSGGGSKFGGFDRCPRCGKVVYMAEKIVGAGSAWHKKCFSCGTCNKKLDSTTVADKEGEIYCKACYGKQFGPKGVGFGQGAGTLSMT